MNQIINILLQFLYEIQNKFNSDEFSNKDNLKKIYLWYLKFLINIINVKIKSDKIPEIDDYSPESNFKEQKGIYDIINEDDFDLSKIYIFTNHTVEITDKLRDIFSKYVLNEGNTYEDDSLTMDSLDETFKNIVRKIGDEKKITATLEKLKNDEHENLNSLCNFKICKNTEDTHIQSGDLLVNSQTMVLGLMSGLKSVFPMKLAQQLSTNGIDVKVPHNESTADIVYRVCISGKSTYIYCVGMALVNSMLSQAMGKVSESDTVTIEADISSKTLNYTSTVYYALYIIIMLKAIFKSNWKTDLLEILVFGITVGVIITYTLSIVSDIIANHCENVSQNLVTSSGHNEDDNDDSHFIFHDIKKILEQKNPDEIKVKGIDIDGEEITNEQLKQILEKINTACIQLDFNKNNMFPGIVDNIRQAYKNCDTLPTNTNPITKWVMGETINNSRMIGEIKYGEEITKSPKDVSSQEIKDEGSQEIKDEGSQEIKDLGSQQIEDSDKNNNSVKVQEHKLGSTKNSSDVSKVRQQLITNLTQLTAGGGNVTGTDWYRQIID